MRLAQLELRITIIDAGKPRQRWNGDPMASEYADAAFQAAVDQATVELRKLGIQIVRTGYGVSCQEVRRNAFEEDLAACASTDS